MTSHEVDDGGRCAHGSGHNSSTVSKVLFYVIILRAWLTLYRET